MEEKSALEIYPLGTHMNIWNPRDFQKIVNMELLLTKEKVFSLIGEVHWWEVGRHREAVLKNVIENFLPQDISVWTWFIRGGDVISKQIDILIYDNSYPLFFKEWDFVIVSEDAVRWIVEVKSTINKGKLKWIIQNFCSGISAFPQISSSNKVFKWIFWYTTEDIDSNTRPIKVSLKENFGIINHLSLWDKIFIKYRNPGDERFTLPPNVTEHQYNVYTLQDLWFSYFISNLVSMVTNKVSNNSDWFYFPISEQANWAYWKEVYRDCVITRE